MISRVSLRDFQRHKQLTLDLDPGVTTLVGPTDAGKSAVLRAIRWVVENAPAGDRMIRRWRTKGVVCEAKAARVDLRVDGKVVRRTRGRGVNTYSVQGKVLRAFGTTPPRDVLALLNVGALSFQGQHDPVFWFSKPPGEVSRELNAIVDLSCIDRTLTNLAKAQSRAGAERRVVEQRLSTARAEVKALRWAEQAAESLEALRVLIGRLQGQRLVLSGLRALVAKATTHQVKVSGLTGQLRRGKAAVQAGAALASAQSGLGRLVYLEARGRALRGRAEATRLVALGERALAAAEQLERLSGLLGRALVLQGRCSRLTKGWRKAEHSLRRSLRGKQCPLCLRRSRASSGEEAAQEDLQAPGACVLQARQV